MQSVPTPMPVDKSPAQRAQIKLYEQLAAVFVFNAAIAGYAIISANTANTPINWSIVIIAAVAQGALALGNTLEKYFSAKSEPLYSSLVEAGRQEVLSKMPPVQLSTQDQALQTAVNTVLQPAYVPPSGPTPIVLPTGASPVPPRASAPPTLPSAG